MLQAGRKHGPAKAVICVSPPQLDKDSAIVAKTESSKTVADGKVQDREDWVDVVSDVSEEADDWVEV